MKYNQCDDMECLNISLGGRIHGLRMRMIEINYTIFLPTLLIFPFWVFLNVGMAPKKQKKDESSSPYDCSRFVSVSA